MKITTFDIDGIKAIQVDTRGPLLRFRCNFEGVCTADELDALFGQMVKGHLRLEKKEGSE